MERLLTLDDVCKLFQFKKSYVYHLTHMREIPHIKIGNHLRFRKTELEAWINTGASGPTNPATDAGSERRRNHD